MWSVIDRGEDGTIGAAGKSIAASVLCCGRGAKTEAIFDKLVPKRLTRKVGMSLILLSQPSVEL